MPSKISRKGFRLTTKKKFILFFAISAVAVSVLLASAWLFVSWKLSQPDAFREPLTRMIGKELNRPVQYDGGSGSLSLRKGLVFTFAGFVIKEKDGAADFVRIRSARLRLEILPLLKNQFSLKDVLLDRPVLRLRRDTTGELNIADLLAKSRKETALKISNIAIEQGSVTFEDQAAGNATVTTRLDNLDCAIDSPLWGSRFQYRMHATLVEDQNKAALSLKGTFEPAPPENPFWTGDLEAALQLKGSDLRHYAPYLNRRAPIERLGGLLDADTTFSGTLKNFSSKGSATVKSALLDCSEAFSKPLTPQTVRLDYELSRDAGSLSLKVTRLAIDRFEAGGRLSIQNMDREDFFLTATAASLPFALKEMRPYIPWKIIPKTVGDFIAGHIRDGNFRLLEGTLKGRKSQITRIGKPENAGVLSLRADVSGGVLTAHPTAPDFHDIRGSLELQDRRLLLRGTKGIFGRSPFTLEGSISDFARPGPVEYTANMTIRPAREEVVWLLGKNRFRNFSFSGPSTLDLSGKGTASDFRVRASWDLTGAAYAFPDVLEKPESKINKLTADMIVNQEALSFSSFRFDLPPLNVNGSAAYRFSGEIPLSLHAESKTLSLREAAALFPVLRKMNPSGTVSLDVFGKGDLRKPAFLKWKGNASFGGVSLTVPALARPVTGLTGQAYFQGDKIQTGTLRAKIGESDLEGNLQIDDLRKPAVAGLVKADRLHARDLGWKSPKGDAIFSGVSAQAVWKEKDLLVNRLSFGLGKSLFTASGHIRDFAAPKITAELSSPFIDSGDIALLTSLKTSKKDGIATSGATVDATVRADKVSLEGFEFNALQAVLNYAPGTLNVRSLEAGVLDGRIRAKGKAALRPDGQYHTEANLALDNVRLEKLQNMMDLGDGLITGNLSVSGHLTASGRQASDLKNTTAGTLQIRAEKGVLKKFSVLSKIFSLLNVSQLIRLKLPDMAKDGMPYSAITAQASVQNGVFSSKDFLITGDAMEISAAGSVDVFRKELDCIAGIHPMQTLDLVASKMPVVGWLILDQNGNVLTIYVKIKGAWKDPNVMPMPVRSIGKETLGIFRRLFQLPEKLITDTGEVILGD
ncbi:MAG TPA: AsmA-like C-terminal domain-containing protein [Smithellaceae bacterium]|nr:AsmA-like C-terminal domain-containing protein [Smithellaceae bacterium]